MKLSCLKLLPLALAATLVVTPTFAHAEDLMQAYQQALANDPTLAGQLAQRNSTNENVPLARSNLLPQLSAGLSLNQENGSTTVSNANGSMLPGATVGHSRTRNLSLQLNQTILNFSDYANLSAAKSQREAANATYQAALQDLIVRVTTAYFDVLTAKDAVDFNQANTDSLKRQYDQSRERFKAQLVAITDVQDAKAAYDSALADLIAAKNSLNDAREALTQITGHPVNNLEVLSTRLPMTPPSPNNLGTWVKAAEANNPTLLASQYTVDAADHSVTAARDARLPTIGATVSYGKGATWYQNGPYYNAPGHTSIGLSLNIPLFTGGAMHAQIKQAIYQRDSAQASLTTQKRAVVRNTRNYFRSVTSGISQVEAAKAAVVSSQSALKATQAGLSVGTQTIVNVLIAQGNLMSAREQYSQARHAFILNKLFLKEAAGALTVQDLKLVNALLVPASEVPSLTPTDANGDDTMPAPSAG
ncbi:MAG TPA: TolC family outer membrane protein [Rhodanobacteraceae bacterium]